VEATRQEGPALPRRTHGALSDEDGNVFELALTGVRREP